MRWPGFVARALDRLVPSALSLGQRGEFAAAKYLRSHGYKIVAGGFRRRYGEIDIVAIDGQTVVFVEVKTRRGKFAGQPVEAVDKSKRRRIVQTAMAFLKRHRLLEHRARFDIIGIVWASDAKTPELTHYTNAFRPDGFGQFYE